MDYATALSTCASFDASSELVTLENLNAAQDALSSEDSQTLFTNRIDAHHNETCFTDGNGDKVDVDGSGFTPDFDASVANPQVLVFSPFAEVVAADDNDLFATICQFEPMQVNEVMNDEM